MKLTGDLKKNVEQSASREAKKTAIEDAGMELTDDELDKVAGGFDGIPIVYRPARGNEIELWKSMADGETRTLSWLGSNGDKIENLVERHGYSLTINAMRGGVISTSIVDCSAAAAGAQLVCSVCGQMPHPGYSGKNCPFCENPLF